MASKVDLSFAPPASSSSVQSQISKLDERIANLKKWIAPQKELANKLMSQFGVQSYEEITAEEGSQDPLSGKLPRSFFEGLRKQEAELQNLETLKNLEANLPKSQFNPKLTVDTDNLNPKNFSTSFDRVNLTIEGVPAKTLFQKASELDEFLKKKQVSEEAIPAIKDLFSTAALTSLATELSSHILTLTNGKVSSLQNANPYKKSDNTIRLKFFKDDEIVQVIATTDAMYHRAIFSDGQVDLANPIRFLAEVVYSIDHDGNVSSRANTQFSIQSSAALSSESVETKMDNKDDEEDNGLVRSNAFTLVKSC